MILRVTHRTQYEYTQPIFPEPSHLYLYPSHRPYLRVQDYRISVHPEPIGLSERMDVENNTFYQMWFNDMISSLTVDSEIQVQVTPYNPFDFLIETEPKTPHAEAAVPYLSVSEHISNEMITWLTAIEQLTPDRLTFVTMVAREIGSNWEHTLRYEADLLSPQECFKSKRGSCRDLSWMMIQMMRRSDIPARFVSGYAFNPELEGHELHGWVELWLRGAGWVAIDPSSGLLATEWYVPLAASYHPANTLPVQGSFRGQAEAQLTTNVSLSILEEDAPD